jgi:hypothetical protein
MELLEPITSAPAAPPARILSNFQFPVSTYDLENGLQQTNKILQEEKEKIARMQSQIVNLYDRVPPIWANLGIYVLLFVKDTCFAICIVILYYKLYSHI